MLTQDDVQILMDVVRSVNIDDGEVHSSHTDAPPFQAVEIRDMYRAEFLHEVLDIDCDEGAVLYNQYGLSGQQRLHSRGELETIHL